MRLQGLKMREIGQAKRKLLQIRLNIKYDFSIEVAWDVVNMYESVSRCTAHIMHRIPQSA